MTEPRLYPSYRYDDDFRLKIPLLLWIALIFGMRHVAVHTFKLFQVVGGDWAEVVFDWRFLISDALVLPLIICTGFRVPDAPTLARSLWKHGRTILLVAYVLDILLFLAVYRDELLVSEYHLPTFIGILVIDGLVIAYLAGSRLVRDVFADFPPPRRVDIKAKD